MSSPDAGSGRDGDDVMPRPLPAMWRLMRLGWRVEPRLLALSLGVTLLTMIPDAVLALSDAEGTPTGMELSVLDTDAGATNTEFLSGKAVRLR